MGQRTVLILVCVAIIAATSSPQWALGQAMNSDWDDINEFLSGVKFEVRNQPDPAVNYVNIGGLPAEILAIGVDIPVLGNRKLGEFVDPDSEFAIGGVECDHFALKGDDASLDLEEVTKLPNGHGQFNFRARGISARCLKGTLYVKNLQLSPQSSGFFGCLGDPIDCVVVNGANVALAAFTSGEMGAAVPFSINEPGADEQKIGLDLNGTLIENILVENKLYTLPERLRIPSCALVWNQQLIEIEVSITNNDLINNAVTAILRFITNALVSAFTCPIVQQFGMIDNGDGTESLGYGSALLANVSAILMDLPEEELRNVQSVDKSVAAKVTALGVALADVAVLNDDNVILSAGRLFVNDILGSVNNQTGTLTVNELVSALTDETGRIDVKYISELSAVAGALIGTAKNSFGYVSGLDKFTELSVLETILSDNQETNDQLKYTLKNDLDFSMLDVGMGSEVVLIQETQPPTPSPTDTYGAYVTATKPLELRLGVGAVLGTPKVAVTTTQAFMPAELLAMPFGNLISPKAMAEYTGVACAAQSLLFANISDVEISDIRLNKVKISGVVDAGLDRLLQQGTGLVNGTYSEFVAAELGNIVRGNLDFINEVATKYFARIKESPNAACPVYDPADSPEPKEQHLLELNSDLVQRVRGSLEKTLFQVNRPAVGINDVIVQLTEALGFAQGELKLEDPIAIELPVQDGFLALTVKRIGLSQLDSFSVLSLLEQTENTLPSDVSPYVTKNVLNLGYNNTNEQIRPLKFNILFEVVNDNVIDGTGIPESQTFEATVILSNLDIDTTLEIRSNPANLYPYSLNSIMDNPLCAANAVIPGSEMGPNAGVRVHGLNFATSNVEVNFDCDGCSLQQKIKTPEAQAALTKEIKLVLDTVASAAVTDVFTSSLNEALQIVSQNCTDGLTIPLRETPTLPRVGLTVVAVANAAGWLSAVVGVLYVGAKSRKQAMDMSAALLGKQAGDMGHVERGQMNALMSMRRSLFLDARFSNVLKLSAIGFGIIAVALMLFSNTSINNSIWARVSIGDAVAAVPSIYDNSLLSLIDGLFYFGATELGIATGICTAFTGYLVIGAMSFCLGAPQTRLSIEWRGYLLGMLNALVATLCVGEKFMILICMHVLNSTIITPTSVLEGGRTTFADIFPEDFLVINAKFIPEPAMAIFFVSVVLILIVVQLVYYMHRQANVADWDDTIENMSDGPQDNSDSFPTVLLTSHRFVVSRQATPVSLRTCSKVGLVLTWFLALVSFFFGMTNPIVEYRMAGAAGLIMELGAPGSSAKQLTGLDFGMGLTEIAKGLESAQSLVVLVVQMFVLGTTFIAPLFILVLLGVLLFAPLALPARRACLSLLIGLVGFNILEMLTILVFATNFYLASISQLSTADVCTQINGLLEGVYVSIGQPVEDAGCAAAEGDVLPAYFVLAISCVLLNTSAYHIMSLTKAALEDQDGRSKYDNREHTERAREKRIAKWVLLGIFSGAHKSVIQAPHRSQYPSKQLNKLNKNQSQYSYASHAGGHVMMQPPPSLQGENNELQFNSFNNSPSTLRATASNPRWNVDEGSVPTFSSQRSWTESDYGVNEDDIAV